MSVSSLSSASHSGPNAILPDPERTTSLVTDCSTGPSSDGHSWELPWLNGNVFADAMNFGIDSGTAGAELRQMPDTWALQREVHESQTVEQILKRCTSHDESHLTSAIDGDALRICDPVSNDLSSPGVSPLHTAAKRGHVNIVRLLLEHDADCNVQDDDSLTPLMHAIIGGYEEVVGLLLSHGAGVQFADYHNRSALHLAVIHRRDRLLKMLLRHCRGDRAVIDGLTREGKTPLHIAVDTDFEAAVEMLLNSGADAQHKAPKSESVDIYSQEIDGTVAD